MVHEMFKAALRQWHGILALPRKTAQSWHEDRLREEVQEVQEARTFTEKLSETSDVFFTISRAEYDGFHIGELPNFAIYHILVYAYMLGKFTSRWAFYRVLAFICQPGYDSFFTVREVTNPGKDSKLNAVALRHDLEPEKFKRVGRFLRRVWPLLP